MIKAEALVEFTLEKFDELKNVIRKDKSNNENGRIYVGDIFDCDKKMARYLLGDNKADRIVIKILEVYPHEKKKEEILTKEKKIDNIKSKKVKK